MTANVSHAIDERKHTFLSIQYLRGLAALSVVVFHATTGSANPIGWRGFNYLAHGVDIFFVISGFIMFTAARRERVIRFILVRIVRIYPLYWLALLITVALNLATTNYGVSGREFLASAILWPFYSLGHPGKIWPILVPGWTLTYEILFYAVFAVGLAARRVVLVPVASMSVLVIAGLVMRPHSAPLVVATSPLMVEFIAGLLIGIVVDARTLRIWPFLPSWCLAAATFWTAGFGEALTILNAAGLVAVALLAEPLVMRSKSRFAELLGDSSYAIYLVHTIVLSLPDRILGGPVILQDASSRWSYVAMMIVMATFAGVVTHVVIERPLLRRLRPLADRVAARALRRTDSNARDRQASFPRDVRKVQGDKQTLDDGIVVYFCYGQGIIFDQTIYSILSLLYVCDRRRRNCRIVVYTDDPERFTALPVSTVSLSDEQLDAWLGESDYIHRRKTCVILDALERFACKVLFVDSDTWFAAHPTRIFARVGPGRAVFHLCEGFVASTGTPFDTALARQLAQVPLALRTNEPVVFGARLRMWNTGVVAVDPADRDRMIDALALSDLVWRTADPVGAYGKKIHHAEQFATGYAFRNCQLSEAADCVYHYWPSAAKEAFGAVIPRLVAQWFDEPRRETLALCYASRHRERGIQSWIEAFKMAIRRAALMLGIPLRGARRSVR